MYIVRRLISTEPNAIAYLTFFKKLQIILIDSPHTFNDIIKDSSIGMNEDAIIVIIAICLVITFFVR